VRIPCVVQYLLGSNLIETENEGKLDCGNGKRANTCGECKKDEESPEDRCSGDCKWDNLFNECNPKSKYNEDDW